MKSGTIFSPWNPLRYCKSFQSLTELDDCKSFQAKFMITLYIIKNRSKSFQLERWNVPELSTGSWNGKSFHVFA
jgi:hypothetical protein